jgi:hypothetical protein
VQLKKVVADPLNKLTVVIVSLMTDPSITVGVLHKRSQIPPAFTEIRTWNKRETMRHDRVVRRVFYREERSVHINLGGSSSFRFLHKHKFL